MSRAIEAEAVIVTLNSIATVFVGLRTVSRFLIIRRPSVDDYLIIAAVIVSWIFTALAVLQVHFGLGQHANQLSSEAFKQLLRAMWGSILAYNIGLTLTKLSALFQILRFCVSYKTRTSAWVLVAIVSTYGVAAPITSVFSCLPVAFWWDKSTKGGKCISLLPFWYFVAFFNIVTDIAVVALPIFVLKDLHLPRRQKLAVIGIFAVGGVTCIIAVVRLESIFIIARSKDVSYDNVKAAMWSAAELNIAIVCACLPSLKPLVQKIAPRCLASDASPRETDDTDTSRLRPIKPVVNLKNNATDSTDYHGSELDHS